MNQEQAPKELMEIKHLMIVNAIYRLRQVKNEGQELVCKITGEPNPDGDQKTQVPSPSLSEFLSNAGNDIANLADTISSIFSQIDSELF